MIAAVSVFLNRHRKCLKNGGSLESIDAENLQKFSEAPIDVEVFFDYRHQYVHADGDPDLRSYSVV